MSEGFLGRWSRRKVEVREVRAVEVGHERDALAPPSGSEEQPSVDARGKEAVLPPSLREGRGGGASEAQPVPPPLSLEDVKALTTNSDFTRFLAPEVAPEVKNAALKKLFSDPHFNAMDGLDSHVGDYTQSDPIPEAMLRKLASAAFLQPSEEQEQDQADAARDVADDTAFQSVAQSSQADQAVSEPSVHDDPDLRLQQDDAAQGAKPRRDTE